MNRVEVGVVLIALSLHGGGILFARSLPKLLHLDKVMQRPMMMEFDTEMVELPQPEPEPRDDQPDVEPRPIEDHEQQAMATVTERTTVDPRNRRRRGAAGPVGDSASTGPSPGPQMTAEDGDWSAPGEGAPPATGVPGVGGISGLTARIAIQGAKAPPAETKAPKAKKVDRRIADRVIKDELRRKDKALGLDLPAAGTIASMIKSAVIASDAPADAAATFQVVLGPGGKVQSVTAGAFSAGNKSTWDSIAAMVKGALKSQKLTLTEDYAKGAIIVVNVKSQMKMPSGAKVGAGLELSLTQNFDVADIGAKPVRVVVAPFTATPVQ